MTRNIQSFELCQHADEIWIQPVKSITTAQRSIMNLLENSDGICADVRSPTIDDIITFQGRSFKPDLINLAFLREWRSTLSWTSGKCENVGPLTRNAMMARLIAISLLSMYADMFLSKTNNEFLGDKTIPLSMMGSGTTLCNSTRFCRDGLDRRSM